eukprot:1415354-Lingulodinium_polyedra.AAC.1
MRVDAQLADQFPRLRKVRVVELGNACLLHAPTNHDHVPLPLPDRAPEAILHTQPEPMAQGTHD